MSLFPSPERLARISTRRPWAVIGVWFVLLLLGVAGASTIGNVVSTDTPNYQTTEAETADGLVLEAFGGAQPARETIVVQSADRTVQDPVFQSLVEELVHDLRQLDKEIDSVASYYEMEMPGVVSADGRTLLIPVTLVSEDVHGLTALTASLDGKNGFTVVSGGDGTASLAFDEQSQEDLEKAELLGLPIALVVLVIVFGSLVAAGIPMVMSIIAIIVAIGASAIIGRYLGLSIFLVNMVTMMGMAVGVDYCLVVIQRFREERAKGLSRDEAIIRTGATASRAVLVSGMTVVVALAGMLLVPNGVFRSLGVGAMVVVLIAIAISLTLLPAVLRLLGDKVNAGRIRIPGRTSTPKSEHETFWYRTSGLVMRHPGISVFFSVTLLLAAAAPYATIKLGWLGASTLPEQAEARRAIDILNDEFNAGVISPAEIVVTAPNTSSPAVVAAVDSLLSRIAEDEEFGAPMSTESSASNTLWLIRIPMTSDPLGTHATAAVERLRDTYIPQAFAGTSADALVTGATASGIDDTSLITGSTVEVFAAVLGFSFIVLLLVFRSIVVPLKAIVMNLLSVGAAYGLMVLVFQHGIGNEWLGLAHVETIESWVPLFMFSVLFGLSMDYHVFLLSRIKERFEETKDNAESVRYGVANTAGMITGAAAIMIAVFSGFASGELVAFQQMGFGLAVAVLLDATIVRIVLVPASMQLLGNRNWFFPSWLEWLPRIDVEGKPVTAAGSHAPVFAASSDAFVAGE